MLFLGIGAVHPPGLPPSSNSPLAAYTEDPVWQQHARYFDSIFAGGDLPHQQTCYKPTSQRRSGREDRLLGRYGTEADALLLLADGSFERSGFSAFLARLDPADSFIFAGVRKPLLDSSATILQDDSGIPLGYFEARRWRFEAFGHYAGPIIMFANFHQPQMAELFKGARPIEFGIGYQWRKNEFEPPPCTKGVIAKWRCGVNAAFTSGGERCRNRRPIAKKDAKAHGNRSDAVARLPNCESSVGRSKIAGVRQNEDIVAIEADLVGWGNGVRYGRGTNAARLLQAGHSCGAGYACCALCCSGHNISSAA